MVNPAGLLGARTRLLLTVADELFGECKTGRHTTGVHLPVGGGLAELLLAK